MIRIVILLFLLVLIGTGIYKGANKFRNSPPRKARRHFKSLRKAIIRELGPELRSETTALMDQCQRELEKILRAKDSVLELKHLDAAVTGNHDNQGVYDMELEVVEQRTSDFMAQMMNIHRLAITREREALRELQKMSSDFQVTMEARREVLEGITFGDFDRELGSEYQNVVSTAIGNLRKKS